MHIVDYIAIGFLIASMLLAAATLFIIYSGKCANTTYYRLGNLSACRSVSFEESVKL
jgi:hypothetical protein